MRNVVIYWKEMKIPTRDGDGLKYPTKFKSVRLGYKDKYLNISPSSFKPLPLRVTSWPGLKP